MTMTKKQKIDGIFKILVEFENFQTNKSNTTLESYLSYLDRLCVFYLGENNEEAYKNIKGMYILGGNVSHGTVKRIVFHIIGLLDKEV